MFTTRPATLRQLLTHEILDSLSPEILEEDGLAGIRLVGDGDSTGQPSGFSSGDERGMVDSRNDKREGTRRDSPICRCSGI